VGDLLSAGSGRLPSASAVRSVVPSLSFSLLSFPLYIGLKKEVKIKSGNLGVPRNLAPNFSSVFTDTLKEFPPSSTEH
jgi:hypothetical protein